jgi:SPOR domain
MRGAKFAVVAIAAGLISACAGYTPSPPPSLAETRAVLDEIGGTKIAPPQEIVVLPRSDFADRFGGGISGEYDETQKAVYLPDDWRYGAGLATLAHELRHYVDDVTRVPMGECGASRAGAEYASARGWNNTTRQEIDYGVQSGCARRQVDAGYDRLWAGRLNDRPGPSAMSLPRKALQAMARPTPLRTAQPGYWLEYGAYRGPDYANRLVKRLTGMGIEAYAVMAPGAGGRLYYRVRSEAGGDRDGAESASLRVSAALAIAPILHRDGPTRLSAAATPSLQTDASKLRHEIKISVYYTDYKVTSYSRNRGNRAEAAAG